MSAFRKMVDSLPFRIAHASCNVVSETWKGLR